MLRKISILLLITSVVYAHQDVDGETSHTFFATRHWFGTDLPIYTTSTRYLSNLKEDGRGGLIQGVVYGGQSTDAKKLARFLCPFNKDTLIVRSNPDIAGDYDIVGANVNLFTVVPDGFESIVTMRPKESVVGGALNFKQEIGDKWWIEGTLPIERVTTNMNMVERIQPGQDGGGAKPNTGEGFGGVNNAVGSFTAAMQAPNLKYGRIDGPQSTSGLADIEFRAGYKAINGKNFYWFPYAGVLLPGGNVPQGIYMFEPIRGNGGHFGVTMGNDFGFPWIERQHYTVTIEGIINGGYLFKNKQVRSIDLNDKQWGRHIALTTEGSPSVPNYGANYLTQPVNVSPRSYRSITLSVLIDHVCAWQAEFGYQFFGRQREHIQLASGWKNQLGIYDFNQSSFTASFRTINNNADHQDDGNFLTISETQLNFSSVAQPSTVSYVFYTAFTKTFDTTYPALLALGASYEVGSSNENMDRWTAWFKADVMF